jgi:hypothetical protein
VIFKNDEELQTKCEKWQKKLRLQDWIVKPKLTRGRDMRVENRQGECVWQLKSKIASIRILDAVDYPDDVIIEQDMEKTLVHELLHLHFAPLYANTEDASINDAQEQAIDCIAYSLVDLYREKLPQVKKELKAV